MNFEKLSIFIIFLFAVFFLAQGFDYPMGNVRKIGFGFFPTILAIVTLCFCALLLIKKNDR